jgi:hypothetical protein
MVDDDASRRTIMKPAYLISGGLIALILFALGTGRAPDALAGPDSKTAAAAQLVKGEVVMLGGEVCVVKDATGKSVLFKVDKETKIDGSVKEGKKVEISASADGLALSIKERS